VKAISKYHITDICTFFHIAGSHKITNPSTVRNMRSIGLITYSVISAYTPQIGLNESIKRQFWEQLDALVSSVPISEKLFIGGDLNGHVGSTRVGFDGMHGGFGYGSRNQEGEGILNFVLAYDLFVTNTLFRKSLSPSNF
jgi:hypothetical protein